MPVSIGERTGRCRPDDSTYLSQTDDNGRSRFGTEVAEHRVSVAHYWGICQRDGQRGFILSP